ncbi:NAD(P)-dependent oxidoreductase [Streptomyces albus subsp. chlorinus]|uniref:NAD(P)-dependent oxidoreductase n=1 Tax=Streptomyces albus TaxID=1888 RepID=UPI001570415E|nr:NAD(P)-dependent oxidoreductase [Streptomyces albus]NSC21584.1 NAD(P)-dependent oxidoreductase [Streptomyces albus subsp. chlorinus]
MSDETAPLGSVAVLGTGTMGAAMARNLAAAGLDVRAWNRTRSRAEPLAADGVTVADEAADAVRGADAVLTVLYDGPAVLAAMRAAAPGLAGGTVWMQSSTVGPDGLVPLAGFAQERGLRLVDAPVLGTRAPAEAGELTVLAAGPSSVRPRLAPVLDAVGSRTLWLGEEPGAASRLKLVVNNWVLTLVNGTAETLALAEGLGVAPDDFLGAVAGGPLDSPYLQAKAGLILQGAREASFPLSGARKDAELIARAAQAAGVRLDATPAVAERLRRAEAQGHGGDDAAASFFAGFDASDYGRGDARGAS